MNSLTHGRAQVDLVISWLLVTLTGTLLFSLLFSHFSGGGNSMDHMGGTYASSSGSFDVFLTGLLVLLVKLFMVILVVAVVVGIVIWIKNSFFKDSHSELVQSINNDPLLKTILVVTLSVVGIVLLFGLLNSFTGGGAGMGYYGGHMGGYGYGYNGFNASSSLAGLLTLLVKVFTFVLVIALIAAVIAYVKKQFDNGVFDGNKGRALTTQDKDTIDV